MLSKKLMCKQQHKNTICDKLLKTANDTNKSYNERKKAVDELNRLVPQYNKQLTVETANTDKAKQALDRI